MRDSKRFAGCAQEIAFERFLRRERNRMEQQIDTISFAADFFEKCFDLGIVGNVTRKKRRFLAERGREFLHVFLQSLALIIENQTRAGVRPCLRDRPRDAALVRHTKYQANFSCQDLLSHRRATYAALSSGKHSKRSDPASVLALETFIDVV